MTTKLTKEQIREVRDNNIILHQWAYSVGKITKDELDRRIATEYKVAEMLEKYNK